MTAKEEKGKRSSPISKPTKTRIQVKIYAGIAKISRGWKPVSQGVGRTAKWLVTALRYSI